MSWTGREILDLTFTVAAGETITGFQVVKLNDDDSIDADAMQVKVCTDASGYPIGIAQNDDYKTISAGEPVTVRVRGVSKAISNTHSTISAGDPVSPGAGGRVDAATTVSHTWILGRALTRAEQLFDEFLVLIDPDEYIDYP
mgnify:CR=1 FL=1